MIHLNRVPRALLHLVRSQDLGLKNSYEHGADFTLYVDADWASDISSCKSVREMITILARSSVSCYSNQQEVVALSSSQQEHRSMCSETKNGT